MKEYFDVDASRHEAQSKAYRANHRLIDVQYDPERNVLIKLVASTEANARDGVVYLNDEVKELLDMAMIYISVILVVEGEEYAYKPQGWTTCSADYTRTRRYRIITDELEKL